MQAYTIRHESSFILSCDLAEAAGKSTQGTETDAGLVDLGVRANPATREIIASVTLAEVGDLELAIQLPLAWPLQDTKLECRKLVSNTSDDSCLHFSCLLMNKGFAGPLD